MSEPTIEFVLDDVIRCEPYEWDGAQCTLVSARYFLIKTDFGSYGMAEFSHGVLPVFDSSHSSRTFDSITRLRSLAEEQVGEWRATYDNQGGDY